MEINKVFAATLTLLALCFLVSGQCPSVTTFQPCLKYVTPGQDNGVPSPGDDCCELVQTLSQECLCNTAMTEDPVPGSGIKIDFQKALGLPKACGRAVPPQTTCNGSFQPNPSFSRHVGSGGFTPGLLHPNCTRAAAGTSSS